MARQYLLPFILRALCVRYFYFCQHKTIAALALIDIRAQVLAFFANQPPLPGDFIASKGLHLCLAVNSNDSSSQIKEVHLGASA